MTNTFEGSVFVSTSTTRGTLADYVHNAFPTLDSAQIQTVVDTYSNIGLATVLQQAVGIMGEC